MRIGLKLWSPNVDLAARADELYHDGTIGLVELYVVPGTFADTADAWRNLGVPFMVHCPHAAHGFNLANAVLADANARTFQEVQRFADVLRAGTIVMHGGNQGPLDEAVRQLVRLADSRVWIENKPKFGMNGALCVGHSPDEVAAIMSGAGLTGFVLDFGHAICAANSAGAPPYDYIERFLALNPGAFHIGDGDLASETDKHVNFGHGTFDIGRLISLVPADSLVTIETPTDLTLGLADFVENVRYLRAASQVS